MACSQGAFRLAGIRKSNCQDGQIRSNIVAVMSAPSRKILREAPSIGPQGSTSVVSCFDRDSPREEITAGLTAPHAFVSPKYLYDRLGSRLFEAITELPEYYPTRTERGILAKHAPAISRLAGSGVTLIDLGAGNCEKARSLFGVLRPAQYVAVDIATECLQDALRGLRHAFPEVEILSLAIDFSAGLALPDAVRREKRLYFYPGSSIGNFTPGAALALLSDIRGQCGAGGGMLIGVDLVKSTEILELAYDDPLGVTAAFNLNLLSHLNALIGSDFDIRDWRHRARFNDELSRIEMHLEAKRDLTATWADGRRHFRCGERIHTENSYKYEQEAFHGLLKQAGFNSVRIWTDELHWFAVCLASV